MIPALYQNATLSCFSLSIKQQCADRQVTLLGLMIYEEYAYNWYWCNDKM